MIVRLLQEYAHFSWPCYGIRRSTCARRLKRPVDIRHGMRGAHVIALQRRRQHKDALLAHRAPKPDIAGSIVAQEVGVALDRPLHKIGHEHRAEQRHSDRDAQLGGDDAQPIGGAAGQREAVLVYRAILQRGDRGQRSGDADRVAVVGAGEKHPAAGAEAIHQRGVAGQRGDRVAVGHGLGEGAQVGRHAADLLVAAQAVAKAGDHLVEDQHHAVSRGLFAQRRQELRPRQHTADIVRDDLYQHGRDIVALRQCLGQRLDIVERQHQRMLDHLGQHAQRERILLADLVGRADHIHQHRVVPAVVGALELDDRIAAGDGARQPQRGIGRLGAGVGQQHPLGRWHMLRDRLGQLHLDIGHARADDVESARSPRARRR